MKALKKLNSKDIDLSSEWTLFLDRDGVINKRLMGDYVKKVEEFEFIPGSLESIAAFSSIFSRIIVVTNQQGIGKGLMTHEDLALVHSKMLKLVEQEGGKIDQVYYCPELADQDPECRKPNTGMADQAKIDFPDIDFQKAIMVGDTPTDLEFGKRKGMYTVYINEQQDELADAVYPSLAEFRMDLLNQ